MPSRLLSEPHLLAHELRTPLTVLAGWWSLIEAGDVIAGTPEWDHGMELCAQALDRLNLVIKDACDEVPDKPADFAAVERAIALQRQTEAAIQHSWRVLSNLRKTETARLASMTQRPSKTA
jgi:signal transduction histidine kinase